PIMRKGRALPSRESYQLAVPTRETRRALDPASSESSESPVGHGAALVLDRLRGRQIQCWRRLRPGYRNRSEPDGTSKLLPGTWDRVHTKRRVHNPLVQTIQPCHKLRE